jgi:chloramphenicol-sensitive protein RarD
MTRDAVVGSLLAVTAFLLWGGVAIYFKAIATVPVDEVLAHRALWSVPFLALVLAAGRRWGELATALRDPLVRRAVLVTTLLLAFNWSVFIWAIGEERVLEASLGYYINPLVNVFLGVVVLRERLDLWQGLAVLLAAVGVLNLTLKAPGFPWVSLALAFSFGIYGLVRKLARVASVSGLFIETSLLLPLALAYLLYLGATGAARFGAEGLGFSLLLMLAGPLTALPLMAFVGAAKRLNYATLGMFQYLAPTCLFLLAVFLYDEPFTGDHLVSFVCIWSALAIYSLGTLARLRRAP